MARQQLSNWLQQTKRWDRRERALRYTQEHVVGQGWMQAYRTIVDEATGKKKQEKMDTPQHIPGFRRDNSPNAIDPDDIENSEWTLDFKPAYAGGVGQATQSWRSKLARWKIPAVPMITNIKANSSKGVMLVTFGSDGAQYTYDHVPREVMYQLEYAAKSGTSVGKLFWELVRYKGKAGGSKYPWWVAKSGTGHEDIEITPEFEKFLDTKVDKELKAYQKGSDGYNMLDSKGKEITDKLYDAYIAEDYKKMARFYKQGRDYGFFE